ncbi:AraC family transcriptional regulator [Alkalibacterium iburiense]|uniref:AraC family transcriptional regulator n=1 Tax=Alkalibacterium iburiense TaxID=290589 RepID=A0ABP3GW44_9LACT
MDGKVKEEVNRLIHEKRVVDASHVLHIVNGQALYDVFKNESVLDYSHLIPFNEAMCVNETTESISSPAFIQMRAKGHNSSVDAYKKLVTDYLEPLQKEQYAFIYLWFGEDMFCQINVLTLLAYLEQIGYGGSVQLNVFDEKEFQVETVDIMLGNYERVYREVLVHHEASSEDTYPLMNRAVGIYLELLTEPNRITEYIKKNRELSDKDLLQKLFKKFDYIGYGDSQYMDLIKEISS